MKHLFLCLLLLGCASGAEQNDNDTSEEIPLTPPKIAPYRPEPTYKVCEVSREDEVHDCTVYTLACEDGSTEYYVTCRTHPFGYVTNTPRPIQPGDEVKFQGLQ